MTDLAPQEQKFYDFMSSQGLDMDVPIFRIHAHMYPLTPREAAVNFIPTRYDNKHMQQRIGALASRVNRKLAAQRARRRIEPGRLKQTYRLTSGAV